MKLAGTIMPQAITGAKLVSELARHFPLIECQFEDLKDHDHRLATRYEPDSEPIEVHLTYPDGAELLALLTDLSDLGVRLVADYMPECGQVIGLCFQLGEQNYCISGEVKHISSDETIRHFGINFIESMEDPGYRDETADY